MSPILSLTLDGISTIVPYSAQGISILNLRYFCSGIDMWKNDNGDINDGILELFTFPGAFYLGSIKVGLTTPKRLAQCKEVMIESNDKFKATDSITIQVDGEARVLYAPFKIIITKSEHSALMLKGTQRAIGTFDICC